MTIHAHLSSMENFKMRYKFIIVTQPSFRKAPPVAALNFIRSVENSTIISFERVQDIRFIVPIKNFESGTSYNIIAELPEPLVPQVMEKLRENFLIASAVRADNHD